MTDEPAIHCLETLRTRDEDRWFAVSYAPMALKNKLAALYAFHSEIRRVPQAVSEPPLGEIRLQWWRDALGEIRDGAPVRAHPVVQGLAAANFDWPWFDEMAAPMIDAWARPLYAAAFDDLADFENWLGDSEARLDELAATIAGATNEVSKAVHKAGVAYAMARYAHYFADAEQARLRAKALWSDIVNELADAETAIAPAIAHLYLTRSYAARDGREFPLVKRLRLFWAIARGR